MSPDSIDALASLIGVHLSVRAAVMAWPSDASPEDVTDVERIGALVRLGVGLDEACEAVLGEEGVELGEVLARGEATGGRIVLSLLSLARRIEERIASCRASDATAVGATLSARIVTVVLVGSSLLSAMRAGFAPTTLAVCGVGLGLILSGGRWMSNLKPGLPNDSVEQLASAVADMVEGGTTIEESLERLSREAAYRSALAVAREVANRGSLWPEALLESDVEGVCRMGRCCVVSRRYGRPLAPALRQLAAGLARRRSVELDRVLRRAPVRMVLPLTLCVLPGSLLVAAGPLIT